MGTKLTLDEINTRFEVENKPIKIVGGFENVRSPALFECVSGHQWTDVVNNVMNRTSTDVSDYCPDCGFYPENMDDQGVESLKELEQSTSCNLLTLEKELQNLKDTEWHNKEEIRIVKGKIRTLKWYKKESRKTLIRKSKVRVRQTKLKNKRFDLFIVHEPDYPKNIRWGVYAAHITPRLFDCSSKMDAINQATVYFYEHTGEIYKPKYKTSKIHKTYIQDIPEIT